VTLPIIRQGPRVAVDRAAIGLAPLPITHILAVGRNYADHAKEMKGDLPERPMLFTKNPASCILSGEPIVIPKICQPPQSPVDEQVDYEGELAIVIGRACKDVTEDDALAEDGPVLGLAVANDVSARWWQKEGAGGQFVRGKSFDAFCPLGPHITPLAETGDPQNLTLTTKLNDDEVQRASTRDMIFPIARLIADCSAGTTLLPGTLILTGTPSGVGHAKNPPRYLREGDRVRIEIESLGAIENPVTLA
jgi:2-keto-4-pentenoate hydratase/2-oxohepta-3-ene-1,7-dioic acid hydratase in catechol pathway